MRLVVALGGNALLRRGELLSADNLVKNTAIAASSLAHLAKEHELVICHGNGPQVGLLLLQEESYKQVPPYPLDVLVAQTQGMMGYLLQQALHNELSEKTIATVITQVVVNQNDLAFRHPTKPIGPVYSEKKAASLQSRHHWPMMQDEQGKRRVVPSPQPQHIVEIAMIDSLLKQNAVVICTGGGGIPVIKDKQKLVGIEAVIDKDYSAALLAQQLQAHGLLILTNVDAVYTDWHGPAKRAIKLADPKQLALFSFAKGSMAPKIKAASQFVETSKQFAVIGHLSKANEMLQGNQGTCIVTHNDNDIAYYV